MELYNEDCFEAFKKVKDKSVNLFLLDLPYGQTACKWDSVIDLEQMWKEIKRTMVKDGIIVFFCTTKFGFTLIQSNPKWFKYDLVWKKSRKVGFLSANKMPLRQHEMIYVFKDKGGTYNPQKVDGEPYKVKRKNTDCELYGTKRTDTDNKGDRHPTSIVEKEADHEMMYVFKDKGGTYNAQKTKGEPFDKGMKKGASVYTDDETFRTNVNHGDRHPTSVIEPQADHEMMYVFKAKGGTYNPQKIKDEKQKRDWNKTKPIKCDGVYGEMVSFGAGVNEGYRHPTSIVEQEHKYKGEVTDSYYSNTFKRQVHNPNAPRHPTSVVEKEAEYEIVENTILEYKNPHKTVHKTQKPVDLCEWLIKSYSNEGDTVMDFCMGSGTTGVACKNTNRKFIGVEKDEEIFKIAQGRIQNDTK